MCRGQRTGLYSKVFLCFFRRYASFLFRQFPAVSKVGGVKRLRTILYFRRDDCPTTTYACRCLGRYRLRRRRRRAAFASCRRSRVVVVSAAAVVGLRRCRCRH